MTKGHALLAELLLEAEVTRNIWQPFHSADRVLSLLDIDIPATYGPSADDEHVTLIRRF